MHAENTGLVVFITCESHHPLSRRLCDSYDLEHESRLVLLENQWMGFVLRHSREHSTKFGSSASRMTR